MKIVPRPHEFKEVKTKPVSGADKKLALLGVLLGTIGATVSLLGFLSIPVLGIDFEGTPSWLGLFALMVGLYLINRILPRYEISPPDDDSIIR